MALHDSALASSAVKQTVLLTLRNAVNVSAYAKDLLAHSGSLTHM